MCASYCRIMALEAVVFKQDSLNYGCSDTSVLGGGQPWGSYYFGLDQDEKVCFETLCNNLEQGYFNENLLQESSSPSNSVVQGQVKERDTNSTSTPENRPRDGLLAQRQLYSVEVAPAATMGRRKRRRTRSAKNEEELENQRMTHIAVERNRRRQMNDYLSVLRSMMPASHVQRGDQASIIGGALNFVKELEQLLQSLQAQKRIKQRPESSTNLSPLFSDFFTFPQYSTCCTESSESLMGEKRSAIADIEVTMVERHANIKVLSRKYPKQLLKMVSQLQSMHLVVLHLNVTTVENMVLSSFSVKVEDDSQLTSANEIAAAVHEMVGRIEVETQFA
ncbi:hypothetical protein F2P56_014209 [Juglans regia]|uniref:BHLH domain-containing protein n=2 Tax=Juglans regia TaxID=51240 RepID=A0A833XCR4_JUGRE|nr:transcription factor bHLH94-like [Juglans regia]KAF5464102.1 hypothetical protein F2P56_014209 [Juglans regia]